MEFENRTGLVSQLLRTQLFYRDLIMAIVVCKATFHVAENGAVSLAGVQSNLVEEDQDSPLGLIPSDIVPVKERCDLCVYGHARPDNAEVLTSSVQVDLRIGSFERTLLVHGDRWWQRGPHGLEASSPVPFSSMPVSYAHAFGGTTKGPLGHQLVWNDNPLGKGFIEDEACAAGQPLPNIEEMDQLVQATTDRPLAAGLTAVPRQFALRGARGIDVDVDEQTTSFTPLAFNHAHPRMFLDSYPAGAQLRLAGMIHGAVLSFVLPALDLELRIDLGGQVHGLRLIPDTLTLFPDQRAFEVVARRAFVYQFLPERLRTVTLQRSHGPVTDEPDLTIAQLRSGRAKGIRIEPMSEYPMPFEQLLRLNPITSLIDSLPVCASA